jgi:hypothetical protein
MIKFAANGSKETGMYKNGVHFGTHELSLFDVCFLMNFGKDSELQIKVKSKDKEILES